MDEYTKYARVYSSISGMFLPFVMTVFIGWEYIPFTSSIIGKIVSIIGLFISSAVLYAAWGYALREMFRSISKWLFQFPLFKEDETEMPTTQMLLWRNHEMSKEHHRNISDKISEKFGIHLYSEKDEAKDLKEAKHLIVDAVRNIRQVTRKDPILLQYNYEFGFCRNYLGASVVAMLLLIIGGILSIVLKLLPIWFILLTWLLQILLSLIAFISLRYRGRAYARQLFMAFMNM